MLDIIFAILTPMFFLLVLFIATYAVFIYFSKCISKDINILIKKNLEERKKRPNNSFNI